MVMMKTLPNPRSEATRQTRVNPLPIEVEIHSGTGPALRQPFSDDKIAAVFAAGEINPATGSYRRPAVGPGAKREW
jgi:hypothetical protein